MRCKTFFVCFVSIFLTQIINAAPRTGGSYYNYGEALQKAIFFIKSNVLVIYLMIFLLYGEQILVY